MGEGKTPPFPTPENRSDFFSPQIGRNRCKNQKKSSFAVSQILKYNF
jgi:hypothetical protein